MKIKDLERNSQFLYLTEAVVNVAYLPPTKHSFEFPSGLVLYLYLTSGVVKPGLKHSAAYKPNQQINGTERKGKKKE